jgi:transglutaminase-like putative cysteine protease
MRGIRAAFAAASMMAVNASAADEGLVRLAPLHVIPTENQSAQPLAPSGPVRVRLSSANTQALAAALGVELPATETSFVYVLDKYPQLPGVGSRTWLEPTFVIDFAEPAFVPLRQELEARGAKTPSELVAYVADIVEPGEERAWDLASVVARRRTGDCSEHAVLVAALARLRGIPARVVVGVAVVSVGKDFGAFGHAWAEVLQDGKWQVADAALFGQEGVVRYLPLGLLEDEGMGYGMDLMRLIQIWVDRVVLLGP